MTMISYGSFTVPTDNSDTPNNGISQNSDPFCPYENLTIIPKIVIFPFFALTKFVKPFLRSQLNLTAG